MYHVHFTVIHTNSRHKIEAQSCNMCRRRVCWCHSEVDWLDAHWHRSYAQNFCEISFNLNICLTITYFGINDMLKIFTKWYCHVLCNILRQFPNPKWMLWMNMFSWDMNFGGVYCIATVCNIPGIIILQPLNKLQSYKLGRWVTHGILYKDGFSMLKIRTICCAWSLWNLVQFKMPRQVKFDCLTQWISKL